MPHRPTKAHILHRLEEAAAFHRLAANFLARKEFALAKAEYKTARLTYPTVAGKWLCMVCIRKCRYAMAGVIDLTTVELGYWYNGSLIDIKRAAAIVRRYEEKHKL